MPESLITIKDLTISYGEGKALSELSLAIAPGRAVAILGESGSGKSTLLKSIAGILEPSARVEGEILYEGRSLMGMSRRERSRLMGNEISMIFQNPESFLDPVKTIGAQMEEILLLHGCRNKEEAHGRAITLLHSLSLTNPEEVLRAYPFELSGGMCQRVSIAMAASGSHLKLILADEPTSALDQIVRFTTAELLQKVCKDTGAALLLVTHDMRLAGQLADEIGIMYRGRLVEYGRCEEVLETATHPYTICLLRAVPGKNTDFLQYERFRGELPESEERQYLSDTHWVCL